MTALTVSEALSRIEADSLDHIFPGSWIGANLLDRGGRSSVGIPLETREVFDAAQGVAEENRRLALEELLIAEEQMVLVVRS